MRAAPARRGPKQSDGRTQRTDARTEQPKDAQPATAIFFIDDTYFLL